MGHVFFLLNFFTVRSCIVVSYCNNIMTKDLFKPSHLMCIRYDFKYNYIFL